MSEEIEVLPDPASLIEAMRAIGYTAETAIADLIDNSISAEATAVRIEYDASDAPYVCVLDNGKGMSANELTNAMRHGSRNPIKLRAHDDLGRFGLGLKTASLSQCRRLTVISKQGKTLEARCWDLDIVTKRQRWVVVIPSEEVQKALPLYSELSKLTTGTLVIWESLDRLMSGSLSPQSQLKSQMSGLLDHLSFVFHRYAKKEDGHPAVDIQVNGMPLPYVDPFLTDNSFTQPLEGQEIAFGEATIKVSPFILPHMSRLDAAQTAQAGGREGLRGNQGFYIYRNRRLVIWGTWFRLVPKEEFYKLTRVKVDIPNTLDHLWALDIKKSAAYPPDAIRNRLKELIPHFANTSRNTIAYPGRRQRNAAGFEPIWQRIEPQHNMFRYEINTENPLIREMTASMSDVQQKKLQDVLELIGFALPLEAIYSDMCADKRAESALNPIAELVDIARRLMNVTGLPLNQILALDPIARHPTQHQMIIQEIGNE